MEVFNSACFIVMIYCTNSFGLKHCVAVPLPTLLNYYDNSARINWNIKFRQSKDPGVYHDKFVFPSKGPWPIVADRSGKHPSIREDTGKIYFPDDTISSTSEKAYTFEDSQARPVWNDQHRPASAVTDSPSSRLKVDGLRRESFSTDGSKQEDSLQLSNSQDPTKTQQSDSDTLTFLPAQSSPKDSEEVRVEAAVREFYEWLKRTNVSKDIRPPSLESTTASATEDATKLTPISDQSLVAGLADRKCKPNQIIVNGECKTKVSL